MAATLTTMNVAAASCAVATVAVPAVKSSPSTVSLGSFRGQRLVAERGVSVAVKRSLVVRAEDKGVGKQIQDAGEDFSAALQRGAENVRDNLQGTQADATGKAKSAANTAESKVKQGGKEADNLGSNIASKAEDLKDQLFGAGSDVQKEADKNVSKAQSAANSAGKDAQKKSGNILDNVQQAVTDAADKVQGKN